MQALVYKFLTHQDRNISMNSNDYVLEEWSIEANNLGHGDLVVRIQDGWSILNHLLDPTSLHYGLLPSDGDLEFPACFQSVAGLKWCGFSGERAERLFNDSLEYRMNPYHENRLNEDLAEYIKHGDLKQEKDWHKAMNKLGINNDLQVSIMDPEFDDIRGTQPVQSWVQEFVLSNASTLQRLLDMLWGKNDQLQGKMAMLGLIDDKGTRMRHFQKSFEMKAYDFDVLYYPTIAERFDDVLNYNNADLRLDALF